MRDEVKVPLVDRSDLALGACAEGLDPLQRIERFLEVILDQMSKDDVAHQTFHIMAYKCEYVGAFARDLEATAGMHLDLREKLAKLYREAQESGLLRAGVEPLCAASDTLIFVSGLIKIWVVDESGALVRNHARRLVLDHVAGKRTDPITTAGAAKR